MAAAPVLGVSELPLGVQMIAAPGQEAHALRVVMALENAGVVGTWGVPGA